MSINKFKLELLTYHFSRISDLLEKTKGEVVFGGEKDRDARYIQPTVLVNVTTDDVLLQDDIFGPILPIVDIETIERAIEFIKSKEKPLALYMFSPNNSRVDKVVRNTSSGAVTINDLIMHTSRNLKLFCKNLRIRTCFSVETLLCAEDGSNRMGRCVLRYYF